MAPNGRVEVSCACLLRGAKRTCLSDDERSAFDPEHISRAEIPQCSGPRASGSGQPSNTRRSRTHLAERICGAADRLDPSGVPRSHRDLGRGSLASRSCGVCRLLQRCPATSGSSQGCAAVATFPTVRRGHGETDPRRTSSRILSAMVIHWQVSPVRMRFSVRTGLVPGKGLGDLLRYPLRRRVVGHAERDQALALMSQDHQYL